MLLDEARVNVALLEVFMSSEIHQEVDICFEACDLLDKIEFLCLVLFKL
jgi:hypothetical protein